jgi:hypothetical protein
MPFGRRGKPRSGLDTRMPVNADKGPYFFAGETHSGTNTVADALSSQGAPVASDFASGSFEDVVKASSDKWRRFNSTNHNGEGQNVLYIDSHVEFQKKPIVGVNNDNIYTMAKSFDMTVDTLLGDKPVDKEGPLTNTDSVIIP